MRDQDFLGNLLSLILEDHVRWASVARAAPVDPGTLRTGWPSLIALSLLVLGPALENGEGWVECDATDFDTSKSTAFTVRTQPTTEGHLKDPAPSQTLIQVRRRRLLAAAEARPIRQNFVIAQVPKKKERRIRNEKRQMVDNVTEVPYTGCVALGSLHSVCIPWHCSGF